MSKKIIIGFAVILFSIFVLTNNAFARTNFFIHMTDGDGHINHESSFGWDELPWLRMHLPQPGWSVTASFWKTPGKEFFFSGTSSTDLDRWISGNELKNLAGHSVSWLDIREVGEWKIKAAYLNAPGGSYGFACTNFTVTPEPLSSMLFLVGGVSLAAARLRRKKRNRTHSL